MKLYEESIFPCYSLPYMKVIWNDFLLLINSYKFMSGYLYLPNNLKDIKYHI